MSKADPAQTFRKNEAMPRVDVVIPTYNRPRLLKRAIESVLAQTYPGIHITVVDDNDPGSLARIETANAVKAYESKGKIEFLRHDQRRNGSAARNSGLAGIPNSSKYVAFLDDDDEFTPERVELMVALLEERPVHFGCACSDWIGTDGRIWPVASVCDSNSPLTDFLLGRYVPGNTSNCLFRTAAIRELGGFDERFERLQDIELFVRLLGRYRIAHIAKPLLILHGDGHRNDPPPEENAKNFAFLLSTVESKLHELNIANDVHRRFALHSLEAFLTRRDLRNAWPHLMRARRFRRLNVFEWSSLVARYVAGCNRSIFGTLSQLNYAYRKRFH